MMSGFRWLLRGLRPGFPLKVVLATYVLATALLPLSHHDIACHLKSSTHCTTCVVGSSAEPVCGGDGLIRTALNEAGSISTADSARADALALTTASGRAPPAIS